MFERLFIILGEAIENNHIEPLPLKQDEFALIKRFKSDYAFYVSGNQEKIEDTQGEAYEKQNPFVTPEEINNFLEDTTMSLNHILRYVKVTLPTFKRFMDNKEKMREQTLNILTRDFRRLKHSYYEKTKKIAS